MICEGLSEYVYVGVICEDSKNNGIDLDREMKIGLISILSK